MQLELKLALANKYGSATLVKKIDQALKMENAFDKLGVQELEILKKSVSFLLRIRIQ